MTANMNDDTIVLFRSVIRSQQQRMEDEYSSFSLLDGEDQELEDEWTDVETRVSDRECVCVHNPPLSQ